MSRLLLPFRRLRWQLTLTYILITLVAAFTLEVATTVASVVAPPKTPVASPPEILVNALYFTEAPQIVPYLEQSPPDQHGLAVWANIWTPGFTYSKLGFVAYPTSPAGALAQIPVGSDGARDVTVVIVGADGQVLASAPQSPSAIESLVASPRAQVVLRAALTTKKVSYQSSMLADGRAVAAVPVAAYDGGPILGALLVAATLVSGPASPPLGLVPLAQIAAALRSALPSALALVILASIVGTLSGILTSRRITRRLGRMAEAADAWRQGELDVAVRDRSPDELGRLAQNLDSMAGQLRRLLTQRQALAVAEERNRLARELHDSVKQRLFAVTMLVGSARLDMREQPDTERTLSDAEQIARQAQQELSALIHALRPAALSGKGFCAAVRELCESWSHRTGVPISVQAPPDLSLSPMADQELYRVVEEALSNIARHSGTSQAWVSLVCEREIAVLRVEDNGCGFDADEIEPGGSSNAGGLGLRSMRERVEGVGGAFQIISSQTGTKVVIRVPLAPAGALSEQTRTTHTEPHTEPHSETSSSTAACGRTETADDAIHHRAYH